MSWHPIPATQKSMKTILCSLPGCLGGSLSSATRCGVSHVWSTLVSSQQPFPFIRFLPAVRSNKVPKIMPRTFFFPHTQLSVPSDAALVEMTTSFELRDILLKTAEFCTAAGLLILSGFKIIDNSKDFCVLQRIHCSNPEMKTPNLLDGTSGRMQ